MRVIHLNLEYLNGLRGGDRCTFETVRYFAEHGVHNILFTTESAQRIYEEKGLVAGEFLQYHTIPSFYRNGGPLDILQAYIRRTVVALQAVDTLGILDDDVLFCHNDFFPNSFPMRKAAGKSDSTQLLYWFHMLAPSLWRGYRGQFAGRFCWPTLQLIRYRLDQWLYGKTIKSRGVIISNNPWYKSVLTKQFPENRVYIIKHYSGEAVSIYDVKKEYDLVWCGRFHAQKGLMELVDVVERLRAFKPDISLLMIGFGESGDEKQLKRKIRYCGLSGNITFAGYLDGEEKIRTYQRGRLFVMPSYFESFGQVNLEAMKCGLPVVAYDLPVYGVFEKGMVKVPIGDNGAMAREILRLLDDSAAYDASRAEALEFSSEFSWQKTGEEMLDLIQSL